MKNILQFFLIILASMLIFQEQTFASSNGKTGKTATNGSGCSCHSSSASQAVGFTFQGLGSQIRVKPGSTSTITAIVAHNSLASSGLNVSVNTDANGKTNVGTLTAVSGVKVSAGEITQSSPKTMVNGSASFTFSWTAPKTPGTYFMRGVGLAVNGDGSEGREDLWNRSDITIIVEDSLIPSISLIIPKGNDTYKPGTPLTITWSVGLISNIDIDYSLEGLNGTFINIAKNVDASTGSYTWTLPQTTTTNAFIRLTQTSGGITTTNTLPFAIADSILPSKKLALLSPIKGEVYFVGDPVNISWEYVPNTIRHIQPFSVNPGHIPYADGDGDTDDDDGDTDDDDGDADDDDGDTDDDDGDTTSVKTLLNIAWSHQGANGPWIVIADSIAAEQRTYDWIAPDTLTDNAFIRLIVQDDTTIVAANEVAFSIVKTKNSDTTSNNELTVVKPDARTIMKSGMVHDIMWETTFANTVRIEYSVIGSTQWNIIADSVQSSFKQYSWSVPSDLVGMFRIRIIENMDSRNVISQTSPFIIQSITTALNGNEEHMQWIQLADVIDSSKDLFADLESSLCYVTITDINGGRVYSSLIPSTDGAHRLHLQAHYLSKGLYIITGISNSGKTYSKPILVQ